MTTNKQRSTFISYSRVNKDFALKLARELKSEGFPIWLDQLDIPAGARWDDEIENALRECGIFMAILTPASIASENAKDEIGYAIDHGKRILPILLEECEIPLRVRRFQYVDFTKMNFSEGVRYAKELLGRLIKEESIPNPVKTPYESSGVENVGSARSKERPTRPSRIKSSRSTSNSAKAVPTDSPRTVKRPFFTGKMVIATILFAAIVIFLIVGTMNLQGKSLDVEQTSSDTPTQVINPTDQPTPTVTAITPTRTANRFYTEEFDGNIDSWTFIPKSGRETEFSRKIEDGKLAIQINPEQDEPWAYLINNAFTYIDVKLEAVVVNNGNNSNGVSLVCRYSDEGWYEFRVSNNGNFSVYAYGPGRTKLIGGSELSNRASTAIKTGRETNVYTAVCKGNELSLEINGTLVETVPAKYDFPEGSIGIGFSAPQDLPVDIEFESVKVSQP
jgi:hypothetical protein